MGFAQNNTVLIATPHHKNLNAKPQDQENLNHQGMKGGWAQWLVEKDGGNFKFKNVKTGKYLRITGDDSVNCGGGGASSRCSRRTRRARARPSSKASTSPASTSRSSRAAPSRLAREAGTACSPSRARIDVAMCMD